MEACGISLVVVYYRMLRQHVKGGVGVIHIMD